MRGDLGLMVKQPSVTGFELVVDTNRHGAVSISRDTALPCPLVGTLKRAVSISRDTPGAHRCQLKPETLGISCFYLSLDPPKSPLRRGTLRRLLSPPS